MPMENQNPTDESSALQIALEMSKKLTAENEQLKKKQKISGNNDGIKPPRSCSFEYRVTHPKIQKGYHSMYGYLYRQAISEFNKQWIPIHLRDLVNILRRQGWSFPDVDKAFNEFKLKNPNYKEKEKVIQDNIDKKLHWEYQENIDDLFFWRTLFEFENYDYDEDKEEDKDEDQRDNKYGDKIKFWKEGCDFTKYVFRESYQIHGIRTKSSTAGTSSSSTTSPSPSTTSSSPSTTPSSPSSSQEEECWIKVYHSGEGFAPWRTAWGEILNNEFSIITFNDKVSLEYINSLNDQEGLGRGLFGLYNAFIQPHEKECITNISHFFEDVAEKTMEITHRDNKGLPKTVKDLFPTIQMINDDQSRFQLECETGMLGGMYREKYDLGTTFSLIDTFNGGHRTVGQATIVYWNKGWHFPGPTFLMIEIAKEWRREGLGYLFYQLIEQLEEEMKYNKEIPILWCQYMSYNI